MPSAKAGGGGKKQPPVEVPINIINGTAGDDVITPDPGSDYQTTPGDDEVFGLAGTDTIDGGDGNDIIHGGDDMDILAGGNGDDTIYGDGGDDFIFGDPGSDTIEGGDGWDTVIYYGELDVDYSFSEVTEVQGKGKFKETVVVGYQITALDGSGDVDTLALDVEEVVFISAPPGGDIVTQSDAAWVQFDSTVTIDVLANDFILGMDPGVGLSISDIVDIQVDLDGDGFIDDVLIPDDLTLAALAAGVVLHDGSILTLNPDDTLTWDPNHVYDAKPAVGEPLPVLYFWYEVSDAGGNTAYGDIAIQVNYPAPSEGAIDFENLTPDPIFSLFGLDIFLGGPDDAFWISQLSTAGGGTVESRDVAAGGDYDYDDDGDEEFRIWTDPDGTTHELNVTLANDPGTFDVSSLLITDLDAGETVTVRYWSSDGNVELAGPVVIDGDVSGSGEYDISRADVGQISIEVSAGGSVYIDDIVLA